ncbi:MAG: T9SS type A sorting domain-containing protein [Salinivirgaceae bacterium]|jgi:hypothetical protein|nr:T9SS type A sorting domain-containing protein [Salinivirgaceae bacterium]
MKNNAHKLLSSAIILFVALNAFSQVTPILNFDATTGNYTSGMCLIDNYIYGINSYGGEFELGTFFKTSIDGTNHEIIQSFNDSSLSPQSIVEYNNDLFITTSYGSNFSGNIFKYSTTTEQMDTIFKFPKYFFNPVIKYINDSMIWGYASSLDDEGNIFKINRSTNELNLVYSFNNEDDGTVPSDFCIVNSSIFVTCYGGGEFLFPFGDGTFGYSGCIVKMDLNGGSYEKIFDGRDSIGTQPNSLTVTDNKIYGLFNSAGNDLNGRIFSFDKDGSNFEIISNINNEGRGKLILSNDRLIGITYESVYQYNLATMEYNDLLELTFDKGWGATNIIMINDSTYAVSTFQGGSNGNGAIILCTIGNEPEIVNQLSSIKYEVEIYPNPASSYINISNTGKTTFNEIAVYNSLGRLVLAKPLNNSSDRVSVEGFNNGIYLIKLFNNNTVITKSVVVD